jgi:hypothetical protein
MSTGKKAPPFEFVLDELTSLEPYTRPMFGCTSVYVGDKIVLILRERESSPRDNGIWLATVTEHHESLRKDFPKMRSIEVFGVGETGWQVLPVDDPGFEEMALLACRLIREGDSRIGKVPKSKKPKRRAPEKRKATVRAKVSRRGSKAARS